MFVKKEKKGVLEHRVSFNIVYSLLWFAFFNRVFANYFPKILGAKLLFRLSVLESFYNYCFMLNMQE